jgi:hypothetical protein
MNAFIDDYFVEVKRYPYEYFDSGNLYSCHQLSKRYFYNSVEGFKDDPKINTNDYQIPEKCIVNLNDKNVKELFLNNFNDIVEKRLPIMKQVDSDKWEIIIDFLNPYSRT